MRYPIGVHGRLNTTSIQAQYFRRWPRKNPQYENWKKRACGPGLDAFPRLTNKVADRLKEIAREQGVLPAIEMLEGWLIFPDWQANGVADSMKPRENRVFPPQSKCLTHSATEKSASP